MQTIVRAAQNGDQQAWNTLYTQCYPWLLAHALTLCKRQDTAKDAVQDTFVTAYLKLEQLREANLFNGWIKQILIRTCFRTTHKSRSYTDLDIECRAAIPPGNELEQRFELLHENNRLHASLASLPAALLSAMLLRYYSTFNSYEQIAAILCIPVGTVRSRISQGKLKLTEFWALHGDVGNEHTHECAYWDDFYYRTFSSIHSHNDNLPRLMRHLDKDLQIVFTSGKTVSGSHFIEREVHEDRGHGSWFEPVNVATSGNLSVLEVKNFNSKEHPYRCPPNAVFVFHRQGTLVRKINFHLL